MKKVKNKALLICLLLLSGTAFSQYQITNSVTGSGGDIMSGSGYIFSSTVGEGVIGNSMNTLNQHYAGFWYTYLQQTITGIENQENVPVSFTLEQNYPNPFNPATKIKYAVPERTIVTIKIYDITGSEMYTLVNKELDSGWYETNFNAAALSSGVYFYRMQAGSYVNIKKMLLIK
jgi:hypothetical protein